MIRTYNQRAHLAGDGILRGHAQARLGIAAIEIIQGILVHRARHFLAQRRGGRLNINGDPVIGVDEIKGDLGIVLIGLRAVGQAYGPKIGAFYPLYCHLGELSRQGGILAAGNA